MNHKARRIIEQLACERRYGIADEKGAEYSGAGSTYKETGADTLHNFKSVAARTGVTPEQTLMTYLLKHMDSINTAIKEAAALKPITGHQYDFYSPRDVYAKGEGIVSRLDDARNYLDLLECLLVDLSHIGNPAEYQDAEWVPTGPLPRPESERGEIHFDHTNTVEPELERLRRLAGTKPESIQEHLEAHRTSFGADDTMTISRSDMAIPYNDDDTRDNAIKGFDGVMRPRSAPEGAEIIPPLCWGETGEL